ncbi:MAG: RNA 2',3'-cyclic phosphodiesterase [Bacteroidales bacterium]|nr:RNA 2',3'-cyclic phosphodiesterase [Bacteroidales bacterium]
MKRLFAAIKISPNAEFMEVFNQIRSGLRHERIKWVEPENIHLTLKFFGETDEKRIPGIKEALQLAVSRSESTVIKINKAGIFGSRYDPRVIWFGIDINEALQNTAGQVLDALEKAGWEKDRQNFVPHLTIGRIKELKDKDLFQEEIQKYRNRFIQEQAINEIHLYESILRKEGPLYLKIATFQLQASL